MIASAVAFQTGVGDRLMIGGYGELAGTFEIVPLSLRSGMGPTFLVSRGEITGVSTG
ncbi:hypothetical protein LNKW23_22440 [Paralimibaculum aggregatum]|uniref:Uncharacterized protein n=1 Tax=Paralimibaculum aggregatum TaxID=3036245 RepID=A0ABQ6LQL2_9RHOB|nr:hypothetical protein [Limibaculum sp. NKW23]GMG83031.1 hypothetical protein LNKW23_22440 [Limibaculum sp. NKW23]